MSPNVPSDVSPDLTPVQERAIELLIAGKTATVAAAEIGVDRRTLHRWRTEDPQFMTTLNARRLELREAGRARLLALIDKATDVVAGSIEAGDVKTALTVLTGLRFLGRNADAEMSDSEAVGTTLTPDQEAALMDSTIPGPPLGEVK